MPIEEKIHEIIRKDKVIQLPKLISDKWGYSKETDKSTKSNADNYSSSKKNKITTATAPYLDYKKTQGNYLNSQYNFFNQLFHNLISVAKIHSGQQVEYNRNLPYVHIKDALLIHNDYTKEGRGRFAKFHNIKKYNQISNDETNNLFTLLFCWHTFENNHKVKNKVRITAVNQFNKVKKEFEAKIKRTHETSFAIYGLSFQALLNHKTTQNKLILLCDVSQEKYEDSIQIAALMLREYLKSAHFSFKNIIIELNIKDIIYIPLIEGRPISNTGFQFPLYKFTDKTVEDEGIIAGINPIYEIDKEILNELNLHPWNNDIFLIKDYQMITSTIVSIVIMMKHLGEIDSSQIDSFGKTIKEKYNNNILIKINDTIKEVQPNLNNLEGAIGQNLYSRITQIFNSNNFITNQEGVDIITTELQENFILFVYECIEKTKKID